jgi:GT2 family glycosyltransferase
MQPTHTTPDTTAQSTSPSEQVRRGQRQKWERVLRELERSREQSSHRTSALSSANAARNLAEFRHRLSQLEGQLQASQAQLALREDKIRRMQASLSWKLTAPLRALRRALVRLRAEPAGTSGGDAPAAPATPQFLWSLDDPSSWDAAPAVGTFRGWFVWMPQAAPAKELRIKIGEETFTAETGLPREDVVTAHGFDPRSSLGNGFEAVYRLEPDRDYDVLLEVKTDDGRWIPLDRRKLRTSDRPQTVHDYGAWLQAFGKPGAEGEKDLRARLAALPEGKRPLLSVLMPVYNAPERWLARAIDSVREQLYDNWELCIADDASPAPHVRPLLERYAAADPRIRVCFRTENGHISAASNSALALVRGTYTALLDHDDEIAPDALAEVVLRLAEHPDADLIYSDEDKIDEQGRRSCPYFKPDYLPDLLTGQNCCSHLSVYRSSLMREIGGFRVGYEGSQDWDLALRLVERSEPSRIHHIPQVLYHWRMISGSTARNVSEKNYSVDAARRALFDHFRRRNIPVDIRPVPGSHWQIVRPLPEPAPLVSVIIPTRNASELLRMCVSSLLARTDYPSLEILIVNNRTDEPDALALLDELRGEPGVRVLDYDAPFNYSAINNHAAKQARGELLCLLNNDIEIVSAGWLREMVSHALRPEIGAVGAMLHYPDQSVQHAGIVLGLGGVANHAFVHQPHGTAGQMNRARLVQNYSAVTAACLVIRRALYEQVGGFDETGLAVAFNDVDFCLRVRSAGYLNLWTPFAELVHHESASRGSDDSPEKKARFQREVETMRRRWGPLLDHDPAYNVNLALSFQGWDLAWPPRTRPRHASA